MDLSQIPKELTDNFTYHGIHVGAYTNEAGEIKKYVGRPSDTEIGAAQKYMPKSVYVKYLYKNMPVNGINIDCRNYDTLDIDEPENCDILERLFKTCTFYVKTNKGWHFYFKKSNKLPLNTHLGILDVNKTNLFYVPTYLHHETGQEFHYTLVASGPLVDIPDFAVDYVRNLMSFKKSQKSKTTTVAKQPDTVVCSTYETGLVSLEQFEVIAKLYFENGDFNSYETWAKAGYALKHLNNSPEAFAVFGKLSRMVPKYANVGHEDLVKAFSHKYDTNFDPTGVFYKCRSINRLVFNNKLRRVMYSITKYKPELIDTQYLWNRADIFKNWMEDKSLKILGIHSSYGTGKTVAFKQVIKKYFMSQPVLPPVEVGQQQIVVDKDTLTYVQPKTAPERVLFINYRKSLTQSQAQDFKEFGFTNYLEIPKEEWDNQNKFIIQLDSIHHLSHTRPYDLVVLDETEGCLSHFSFAAINQTVIHSRLIEFINKSKKVIMLDGDIGMRTFDFVRTLPNSPGYKFYKNTFRPHQKHFVIWNRNDRDEFIQSIENDLAAGENVVLLCMDRGDSSLYYEQFKDRYATMIHNSKERNAHVLRDVKTEWRKCRLLIYSPTVEAGIDFSLESPHFTRLYGMMSIGSTSVRGFNQMMSRVRQFKDNTVHLYNSLPTFSPNDMLIDYRTVRETLYQFVPEITNLVSILIHNQVEQQNSQDHFCTVLADMIEDKGHTYELRKAVLKQAPCNESKKALELKMIIAAPQLNESEYDELQSKLRHNVELTKVENYAMLKYLYETRFNLPHVECVEDLDDFYGKLGALINWRKLTKTNPVAPEISEYLKHIDYDTTETMRKLIKTLGYTLENKVLDKINLQKPNWISVIKADTMEMLNDTKVMLQLGKTKAVSDRTFHSVLQAYLGKFGYKFEVSERKFRSVNSVRVQDYLYEITEIDAIGHLLDTVSKQGLEDMECQID